MIIQEEVPTQSAEEALNAHNAAIQQRGAALNKARTVHMKEFQAKYQKEQQEILQKEIAKKTAAGEYSAMFGLMKDQATKMKNSMAAENMRFMALHGHVWDPKTDGNNFFNI
jgi:hypothetical protein